MKLAKFNQRQPNKFHSKPVCFGGRKTREERNIFLKIFLFGFPEMFVMGPATTAARKVVSSSTLIGPVFSCFLSADKEAAASKRMEV